MEPAEPKRPKTAVQALVGALAHMAVDRHLKGLAAAAVRGRPDPDPAASRAIAGLVDMIPPAKTVRRRAGTTVAQAAPKTKPSP